jgi:hypothetical protein
MVVWAASPLGESSQTGCISAAVYCTVYRSFLDSIATLDLPGWGYGIRYKYGMFKQVRGRCMRFL